MTDATTKAVAGAEASASPVDSIVLRYRAHLRILDEGPATVEQFSKSPYFVSNGRPSTLSQAWYWDEHQMRLDQCMLARAFVEDRAWKEKYIQAMEQHGFKSEDLE